MIKVRILDQCEFSDGEVSVREANFLTAIDHAKCALALVWGEAESLRKFSDFHCIPHIKFFFLCTRCSSC